MRKAIAAETGSDQPSADPPASTRTASIASGPYATDESASAESTGSAISFPHPLLRDRRALERRPEYRAADVVADRLEIERRALVVDRRLELVRRRTAGIDVDEAAP